MLTDRIDAHVMDKAGSNLKVISSYSTGFEHIDVKEATARGIYVTYTADILAEATADLAFGLILACARNIVSADEFTKNKKWKIAWSPDLMLGYNVYGSTLGIIGLGRIGSAVARRARGFNMKVIYHNRKRNQQLESELRVTYVDLDELLAQSDLLKMKNVVLLPHIGSATYQTRSKMAEVAARNLLDVLIEKKEPNPKFLVNPEVKNVRPL
jgi:glyoxylate reductase